MTPYYDRDGITVYCGDNVETLAQIDCQFDLTVTSPPYDNLRDYNGYSWDFDALSKSLFNCTAKGGVVVWVVGDKTVDGSETGTSFRQALGFMGLGFRLHDTMIYGKDKPPMNDNRYQASFEFMFVFSKGKPKIFNPIKVSKSTNDKRGTKPFHRNKGVGMVNGFSKPKEKTKIKDNYWFYVASGGNSAKDKIAYQHPAIFPEALARDHIISWSNPNDIILDPFLGSGTTLKMAQQLNRQAIGIELSEEYCQIAVERLRQPTFYSLPTMATKKVKYEQGGF